MPFASEQYLAQAEGYQKLVDEGNRAIDDWGEYKICARFIVTYYCKRNTQLLINRPLAEKEIRELLENDSPHKKLNYDDFVKVIHKWDILK